MGTHPIFESDFDCLTDMDILKNGLGPGGIGLLSDECTSTYLDDFNLLDVECGKATISKGLGLAIIAGSILVKLPQILNIMKAKSADGLSFIATALELWPCATIIGYALARDFPFTAWGESGFMAIQTLFIAYLICSYNGNVAKGFVFSILYCALIFTLTQGFVSVDTLGILQMSNVPIIVISRFIQILANYQNGHTGQLSFVTTFMIFAGGLARILTSIQETGDMILIINFSSGAAMSAILVFQLLYYKEATAKMTEKKQE